MNRNMEKNMKTAIWITVFMVFAGFSRAQQVLTLEDALGYALKASQTTRKARLEIENGRYKIDEVRARALPQLSGNGTLTYNPVLQLTPLPGEVLGMPGQTMMVAFGKKWSTGAVVSLSQSLFDQGIFTGLKAAESTQEYYQINADLTTEQLIEQVAGAYYQVLVHRHQSVSIDSMMVSAQKVLSVIKGQYDTGLARKIDLDRVAVNIANLQSQLQQLQNTVMLYENQLKYAMGMPIETAILLPEVDFSSIQPPLAEQASGIDLTNRTEMKLLEQQGMLLKYQKDSYKAEYYPSLSLNGNYGYQGIGNAFPWGKTSGQGANWFDYASVGLTLKVPLFNGGATRSRVRQAEVEIRKFREDLDQTKLSLRLQFENAKTRMHNNLVILNNQQTNVELAKEVLENTQNNYTNGLAPLTDLLDAETSLTEANNNYAVALLNYKLAEIQILKSKGELKSLLKN